MFRDYDFIYFDDSVIRSTTDLSSLLDKLDSKLIECNKMATILGSVIDESWDFCMGDSKAYENMLELEKREDVTIRFDYSGKYNFLETAITDRIGKKSQILITRDATYAMRLLELNEIVDSNYLAVALVNRDNEINIIKVMSDEEVSELESGSNEKAATITDINGCDDSDEESLETLEEVQDAIRELKKQLRYLQKIERRMRGRGRDKGLSA